MICKGERGHTFNIAAKTTCESFHFRSVEARPLMNAYFSFSLSLLFELLERAIVSTCFAVLFALQFFYTLPVSDLFLGQLDVLGSTNLQHLFASESSATNAATGCRWTQQFGRVPAGEQRWDCVVDFVVMSRKDAASAPSTRCSQETNNYSVPFRSVASVFVGQTLVVAYNHPNM